MSGNAWKSGRHNVHPSHLAKLDEFRTGDVYLGDSDEAVRILCTLRAIVASSPVCEFPHVPEDCFCGRGPNAGTDKFQMEGQALRFIINATRAALKLFPAEDPSAALDEFLAGDR